MNGIDTAIADALDGLIRRWRNRRAHRAAQRRHDAQKQLREAEQKAAGPCRRCGHDRHAHARGWTPLGRERDANCVSCDCQKWAPRRWREARQPAAPGEQDTLAGLGRARLDRIDAEVAGFAREVDEWDAARRTW